MNKLSKVMVGVLLALVSTFASAQTILTNTTLSAAVTSSAATSVSVTSATGITTTAAAPTVIYADQELMSVRAVSGTVLSVVRGYGGTKASTHINAAFVLIGPPTAFRSNDPAGGSCTRNQQLYLPWINIRTGMASDCVGGQWHTSSSNLSASQRSGMRSPDPGGTALTALETAGTAPGAATEQYCTEIFIPETMVVTGLGLLNGTTVATDKHLVALYDGSGNLLANSAVAGATTANASTYQKMDFTAKYLAVGPGRYFACAQSNGTTDTIRHTITAVNNNVFAGKITGQTFGTLVAITPPSTFTTALGPYFLVY